jgi:hypothetical protein
MSRSAFRCVRGVKQQRTILHAQVGLLRFDKKPFKTCYASLCFLHPKGSTGHIEHYAELLFLYPVGSIGHVGHFGASGERIFDTIFFKVRWGWYGFDKKRFRTRYAEHLFSHLVGSVGQVVHSDASSA